MVIHNLNYISTQPVINRTTAPELYAFTTNFFKLIHTLCQKSAFPNQPLFITTNSRIQPVLEYIKTHIASDLTIEHVASHYGFSVRNLTRLFTQSGIRFVHFLNYHRIIKAIELLTDNTMSIEQIAYQVGYNSPNSFSRVFKQITGEYPSKYIRKTM